MLRRGRAVAAVLWPAAAAVQYGAWAVMHCLLNTPRMRRRTRVCAAAQLTLHPLTCLPQYYDVLQRVGQAPGTSTLFLNHAPGSMSEVGRGVREGVLQADAAARAALATAAPQLQHAAR